MAKWFYLVDGQEIGPLESAALKYLAESERLMPDDKVRRSDMAEWLEARHVKGLFVAAPPQAHSSPNAVAKAREVVNESNTVPPPQPNHARNDSHWLEDRNDLIELGKWKSEFHAIPWHDLFPISAWLKDRTWSLLWVQFFVFAFCFPFLLIEYYQHSGASVLEAASAFSLYFAILWAAFLHGCMRPSLLRKRLLLGAWLFTAIIGSVAANIMEAMGSHLPVMRDLVGASESASLFGRLVGFTVAVGVIEEAVKAVPVVWVAFRSSRELRPTSVAYIGVISGLAFGSTEAIFYSLGYAAGHSANVISDGNYLVVQVLRFVSLPLLHAVWSGIMGYFIGFAVLSKTSRRALLVVGFLLVSMLHGAYDAMVNGWLGLAVAMASLFLFIGYIRTDAVLNSVTLEHSTIS